ncbi:hypothetical protein, conserved [Trypanosoma brucei gambiense DAL972]|uniref:MORN repeat n=1 Tax=Trypanosoma brucei gambiense (strain MHOM/CI/86/DAL972) TaxID=679716 RepID=D0A8G8_TRYB9|nr:hypothetical protein, conserved [Trypanosoma brucei gambiense DAL972]CBH17969.1 hypothetical protein, conserved [Trypanosoma brucei gambiense DAL972]|eukprot:XP_011780233.1 hypothetical protein, conserved [Trypanosoma brucei gambiense DAL972]
MLDKVVGDQEGLQKRSYTYKSGAVYEGTFQGTKRHGRGHWKHPSGEVYEGEYVDNRQEGLGVYYFSESGKRYVGNWMSGKMNGEGVYFFSSSYTPCFVGFYTDDKKCGKGFYCHENGVVMVQEYVDGVLHSESEATPVQRVECMMSIDNLLEAARAVAPKTLGEAPAALCERTFKLPSGATYCGQYSGSKKQGVGYWEHPEGDWYEGQFEQNKHHGWGVYVVGRSGKKYVGHWRDGKMDGVGVYFFNPQETEYFIGSYRQDVKHGRGLYHFAESGSNKIQLWGNGEIVEELVEDDGAVQKYHEAMKRVIEITRAVAPKYFPLTVR